MYILFLIFARQNLTISIYFEFFFEWHSRLIFYFYQYIELQLAPFCRLTLQQFSNRFQGCVALLWHFTKWKNRKCKNPKCTKIFASNCLIHWENQKSFTLLIFTFSIFTLWKCQSKATQPGFIIWIFPPNQIFHIELKFQIHGFILF